MACSHPCGSAGVCCSTARLRQLHCRRNDCSRYIGRASPAASPTDAAPRRPCDAAGVIQEIIILWLYIYPAIHTHMYIYIYIYMFIVIVIDIIMFIFKVQYLYIYRERNRCTHTHIYIYRYIDIHTYTTLSLYTFLQHPGKLASCSWSWSRIMSRLKDLCLVVVTFVSLSCAPTKYT